MLSIIIPHYHEHPQLLFTLQALECELSAGEIDYEILLINNAPNTQSDYAELDTSKYVMMIQDRAPHIKQLEFLDKMSHWGAKNLGIDKAAGDALLFLDAHVVPSRGIITGMYRYYTTYSTFSRHTSLHLPISYMLRNEPLIYALDVDLSIGKIDYHFTPMNYGLFQKKVIEVPCMSTCGMMIRKNIMVELLQKWPAELGQYSGGEQYFNFVGALLGLKKYVFRGEALHHYAAPRSYALDNYDVYRNRAIAVYLLGDEEIFINYTNGLKNLERGRISPRLIRRIQNEIPNIDTLNKLKHYVDTNKLIDIRSWIDEWIK